MILISHRGNLNGPNKQLENNPNHILDVLKKYNVEIDLWYKNEKLYLGHDEPTYEINFNFFTNDMWIHCKNFEAVEYMQKTKLNWFWHENDKITVTSNGYIWCFPKVYINNAITVELNYNKNLPKNLLGICTDYPEYYNE